MAVASHKDNLFATAEVNLVDQQSSNLLMVWHRCLGHVGFKSLQCLASLGRFGSLTKALAQDFKLCVGCLGGNLFCKGILGRFKNTASSTKPLELVQSDVCGPFKASRGGLRYFFTFQDDYTKFALFFFVAKKSEVFQHSNAVQSL